LKYENAVLGLIFAWNVLGGIKQASVLQRAVYALRQEAATLSNNGVFVAEVWFYRASAGLC
jgi:hypothetical protein